MVKVVAVVQAKSDLSRDAFLHEWQNEHPALVRKLPNIRRYRQNPAIEHKKRWPFSGMAELWFDSVADVKVAFEADEAAALFAHEELFLDKVEWFLADEREIEI